MLKIMNENEKARDTTDENESQKMKHEKTYDQKSRTSSIFKDE